MSSTFRIFVASLHLLPTRSVPPSPYQQCSYIQPSDHAPDLQTGPEVIGACWISGTAIILSIMASWWKHVLQHEMCGDKVKAYLNWPQYLHLVFPFEIYLLCCHQHCSWKGNWRVCWIESSSHRLAISFFACQYCDVDPSKHFPQSHTYLLSKLNFAAPLLKCTTSVVGALCVNSGINCSTILVVALSSQ